MVAYVYADRPEVLNSMIVLVFFNLPTYHVYGYKRSRNIHHIDEMFPHIGDAAKVVQNNDELYHMKMSPF